ncbi:MAG TPA: RNA polymerase sigma factor [Woeseiaceae bacterium]|jgi:RNA polymerase sigma-70 factor (ECF subfamily)|nr:RNA polymerase sigma factor [Woeseiaceae bacterium]
MTACTSVFAVSWPRETRTETTVLEQRRQLDQFLADVERRALRIAEIAVRDRDEALDLVQEAMIKLARNYAARSRDEWTPLFYRILQNGIRDWHRRQKVRNRVMVWLGRGQRGEDDYDPVATAPDPAARAPAEVLQSREALQRLEQAVRGLPPRQREAFMLRTFEGLDVAGTAVAMGCSQGSVKTHYSRAIHTLREQLGDVW